MKNPSTLNDSCGYEAGADDWYSGGVGYQAFDKYRNLGNSFVDGHSGYCEHHVADLLPASICEDSTEAHYSPPIPPATAWRTNDTGLIDGMHTDSPAVLLADMLEDILSDSRKPTNAMERVTCMPPKHSAEKSSTQLHPQVLLELQVITIDIGEQVSWNNTGLVEIEVYLFVDVTASGPADFYSIVDLIVSVCSTMASEPPNTAETISVGGSSGPRAIEKRKREGDKDEDIDPHREGESRLETAKKRSREGTKGAGFACPFFKKDAVRFRICCNFTAKKISHVKQHLNRVHFRPSCFRCHVVFSNDQQLHRHQMEAVACDVRVVTEFDWITVAQRDTLSHRSNPRSTEEEQWFFIFDVLFPGRPRPRSPYVEAGLSTEMSAFADFIRERMAHRLQERISANPVAFNDNLFSETHDIIGTIIAEFTTRWATDLQGSNTNSSLSSSRSANTLSMVMPSERTAQETSGEWGITDLTATPLPTSPTMRIPGQEESANCQSKVDESSVITPTEPENTDPCARQLNSEPFQRVKPGSEPTSSTNSAVRQHNGGEVSPLPKTEGIETESKYAAAKGKRGSSASPASDSPSEVGSPNTGDPITEEDATKNGPLCPEAGCNARFKTRKDLARHANSKHQKSVLYPCPECSKEWTRKDNMVRHRRTVHGSKGIESTTSEERT